MTFFLRNGLRFLVTLCLFTISPLVNAEKTVYLCIIDKAAGFNYSTSDSEWKHAKLEADDKYLLTKTGLAVLHKTGSAHAIYVEK